MIGKLQVWKGDRKDGAEKMKLSLGGFVSIDELQPKSRKKKSARTLLGRTSFSLKPGARDNDLFSSDQKHDIPLFSNIPGDNQPFGADLKKISSTPTVPPPSPVRPKTADHIVGRRRSRTGPDTPSLPPAWSDKPLPLAVERDRKASVSREREGSLKSPRPMDAPRPATSAGTEAPSGLQGKRNRSDTALSRRPSANVTYSLTPAITPSHSRRTSRATIAKVPGLTARHHRSASQSTTRTVDTVATVKACPLSRKGPESSILDEVEGTLSATITELQELQAGWQPPSPQPPPTPSTVSTSGDKDSIKSSPSKLKEMKAQDYFASRPPSRKPTDGHLAPDAVPTLPGSQSLPPTPLNMIHPKREASPDPRLHALEQAYDSQKRKAHSLSQENELLRKQLSVALKRIAESDVIRNERDKYERELKEAKQKVEATSEELNTAKMTEVASKSKLDAIQARLSEAYEQKIDVLEANHDLRQKMSRFEKQITELSKELSGLRKRPEQAVLDLAESRCRELEERNKHLEEQFKDIDGRVDLPTVVADLTFKLDDAQRKAQDRESLINSLEKRNEATVKDMEHLKSSYSKLVELNETLQVAESSHKNLVDVCKSSTAQISELKQMLADREREARTAKTEKEKFQQLLHAEFRRSAVEMHNRQHPNNGLLDKRMDVEAAMKDLRRRAEGALRKEKALTDAKGSKEPRQQLEDLHQELSYHLTDIILYKLDVKGYKKDLRKAQAKMRELQSQNTQLTGQVVALEAAISSNTSDGTGTRTSGRRTSVSSATSSGSATPTMSTSSATNTSQSPQSPPMTPLPVLGVATTIPLAGAIMISPVESASPSPPLPAFNEAASEVGMALTVPTYVPSRSSSEERSRSRSPVNIVHVRGHAHHTGTSATTPVPVIVATTGASGRVGVIG